MYKKIFIVITTLFLFCTGCTNSNLPTTNSKARIISLSPSITETLIDIEATNELVAVDTYSDFSEVNELTKIDVWNLSAENVITFDPTLIIAPDYMENTDAMIQIEKQGYQVEYIIAEKTINDIYGGIALIGEITNHHTKATQLIKNTKQQIKAISEKYAKHAQKTVYFEISSTPNIYTFGENTFINEMVEIANGKNIFANESGFFMPSAEAIIEKNPDVIITNVETDNIVKQITSRAGYEQIKAVKNGQVHVIDANRTSQPSAHIVEGIEEIAYALHEN